MVRLCHTNDFGSLELCSQFAIRVLALLFAFQLVTLGCAYLHRFCVLIRFHSMESRPERTTTEALYDTDDIAW
jgi:hypothetical protein